MASSKENRYIPVAATVASLSAGALAPADSFRLADAGVHISLYDCRNGDQFSITDYFRRERLW